MLLMSDRWSWIALVTATAGLLCFVAGPTLAAKGKGPISGPCIIPTYIPCFEADGNISVTNNAGSNTSQQACVPYDWRCDGDKDCPNGDDEFNCPIAHCANNEFECKSSPKTRCINKSWLCDGEKDCDNGEDEAAEICRTVAKKGERFRGILVDSFRCLPNHFRCPGTRTCIHITRVCDNLVDCPQDGADEGPFCSNRACSFKNCMKSMCKETYQGAVCFCEDGQEYNGSVCKDINECDHNSFFCDQKCQNQNRNYTCSCDPGYKLTGKGECQVSDGTSPKLVLANFHNVQFLDLSDRAKPLRLDESKSGFKIVALDVNIRNRSICWVTYVSATETSNFMCASVDNFRQSWKVVIPYSLENVKALAMDWLSGNWYFADDVQELIFMCTNNGSHCRPVVTKEIKRPRSLAIDSTKGYLFFSDWNTSPFIGRIDLNGSNLKRLADIKIVHPNGLTLDIPNSHLYWGDSFLDVIERMDYDSKNRMVITKGNDVFHIFGMTILENYLYVANHLNNTIMRVHRYDSSQPDQVVLGSLWKPGNIKIYHPVVQPINDSIDVCRQAQCAQVCVPVPAINGSVKANCECHLGYTKIMNKCLKLNTTQFILLTNGQQGMVHSISTDIEKADRDVYPPIVNLKRPNAVDFDASERLIYFSDVARHVVGRRQIDVEGDPEFFMSREVNCDGLAVDWLGRNLYCADSRKNGSIFAISLKNSSLVYTLLNAAKAKRQISPKALVVDPNKGVLYWTEWMMFQSEGNGSINKMNMDGTGWTAITSQRVQWPNGLVLDPVTSTLYWTDAFYDVIESISTDGSKRKVILKFETNQHSFGLTKLDNILWWADSMNGSLMQINLITNVTRFHRSNSPPVYDVKLYDKDSQKVLSTHPCLEKSGGCSDFCLLTPIGILGHVCKCADGRYSSDYGTTCTGNIAPATCQNASDFQCSDGNCINHSLLCNGVADCRDGSDEEKKPNGVCGNHSCPGSMSLCNTTQTCIYSQFVCDGEIDCPFGDDESNCPEHTCSPDNIQCPESNQCIPSSWKCDGQRDCPDGSDEGEAANCCPSGKCGPGNCTVDEFTCLDGRCINYKYRCDNEYDCFDNSDEIDCGTWCDPLREFKCGSDGRCLLRQYQCDGEVNCADASDEKNCEIFCHQNEFTCLDGTCLKQEFHCDGNKDCIDGSDEINCSKNKSIVDACHWTQFRCKDNTQCIPSLWQCDGEFDCLDKSDEKQHCEEKCQYPKFACDSHPSLCLAPEKLCDNVNDCPDHSDEGRLCEYDMCLNHDCEEICHKSPKGIVCSCGENKRLNSDMKTCVDINICEKWGICSQSCQLTPQGHRCLCSPGYNLRSDGYSCKANDNETVSIIFSNRHEIRRLNLHNNTLTSLVSGLRNTIALDFHYKHSLIFWTDVIDDKIYRGQIESNSVTKIEPIIEFGLATTEGVAIDWIADNIYWVESNLDQIEVAKLDGSNRTTLIAGNMTSPRAIVLDPRVGKLFWTDWEGSYPRIETCSMAGELHTRDVVHDIRNHKGSGWPNGLAADYENMRLYWVDARSGTIHSITYEGKDHHLILSSNRNLNHPFSLTVFEHHVYWTDWRYNTLVVANKFNGSDVTVIQRTYTQPFDLQIYHPKRQPQMENPCKNSKCSHLCLIGDHLKPVCRCPHRFKLSLDGFNCIGDNTFLLFAKANEIRGVDLENAHYNVIPSITVPFVENATSIDYDVLEERLYWTDMKRNVITSAFLNGTGITTVIDSGLSNPSAFAIDWMSRNMYFTSYTDKEASISVAKLDGAFRKEIYSQNKSKLNSMVIHPYLGVMFWSDLGGSEHAIWKANMDGKNSHEFVKGVGVHKPSSLTLDIESGILYWISQEEDIYSCNITHNTCEPNKELRFSIQSPTSMAIYKSTNPKEQIFLFYANKTNIIKYNKGNKVIMREDTLNVYDMLVYDPSSRKGRTNVCSVNNDNGGCEQLCLPSGESRVCECTVGYQKDDLSGGKRCNGIGPFLLYSQSSEIHGITMDTKRVALAPISKISLATSVDFHAVNDHIYWVDSDRRMISRIKRDLSERETIVSDGISGAESLAVDWIAGNIYWTDQGHSSIEVATLNGTNRYVILHEDIEKPRSIVVNPAKGYLYFANGGAKPRIVRARLDGSERIDFVVNTTEKSVKAPYGLAIDYKTDDLYWCDKDSNVIERVTPKGERFTILSTNLTDCMSLAVFGDSVYWADVTEGSIKYVDKMTGQGMQVMLREISRLKDIKVFDARIQTGSNPCKINNGGCQVLCLYKGDGQVTCACSHGKLAADNKTCEEHDAFLLYSEVTALKSLTLDNTSDQNAPIHPIQNVNYMKNVIGLTFDYVTQRIFFSDIQQGNIQSVFFNGTGFKIVMSGVGSAEGLAFESIHRHLYWTSYSGSSINRIIFSNQSMSMDYQKFEVFVQLDTHDHPRDIVVNSCVRRVFWTNWSDQRPSIQTAAFDSRGRMNGTESIITDKIRTPNGLTMDYKAHKLYWSDARLDKIERCDFDGSNRIVIVTTIPQHSFGLAVYGNFLYWTDWMLRAVIRASKFDGSGVTWLKKNINRQPMGIIAIAADADNCTLNPCHNNAFGCSEICMVDEKGEASCRCKEGKKLIGGKGCVSQSVEKCEEQDFICEDHKLCIPFDKTCNNVSDCLDASDESSEYCNSRNCPVGWYQCQGNRKCILQKNICDGWNDCVEGSDELNCPCAKNEFRCTNGMCILDKYKCDYDSDCPDHSDEIGCNKTCDDLEISGVKHHGLVPCNTTSMCIYPSWICDGSNDCWDNNDEANCENIDPGNCSENSFKCTNGQCILPQWRCDKEADCTDGSDELNCTYTCDIDQHACSDYTCFPNSWVCDGNPDCLDHSDEPVNCTQQNCTKEQFQCPTGRCILKEWLCDGDNDCPNGEDERMDDKAKCARKECGQDQFLCLNRRCVKSSFYCDGENDCGDNSDEPDTCVYGQCTDKEFACNADKRVRCIQLSKRCNGWIDCPDHSDEKDCPQASLNLENLCQNDTHFLCHNNMCIVDELVCNGNNDCGDNSDEPFNCHIDECNSKRPVCSQICVNKKIGYECQCYIGYYLELESLSTKEVSPNRKCVDVDECTTSLPCNHYCANSIGSFKCSCAEGYRLLKDGKTCIANGPEPLILISNRYYLRVFSLSKSTNTTVTTSLKNSVAVDYDWKNQMIYWSDITSDKSSIARMGFNFTSKTKYSEPEVLHNSTVRNPDGLAVDWIGRNLYWCDKTADTIEVSKLDGKYRRILLREGLQEPRALEVFPQKGLLFFTDWGDIPHISRMNMDGTDLRHIINESIAWPNALTIDYITEKVFWGDGNLDYIGMADLDGQNARVIIGDNKKAPHVFALATFEGHLYWTDWENKGVFYTTKFSGHNVTNIVELIHRPMDIQVVHPLRQVPLVDNQGLSVCDYMGCSHLCLLRPGKEGQGVRAVCSCPENYYLAKDDRTCISNCTTSQFLCSASSKCIPFWWKCDRHPDCEDGSDEPVTECDKYHCTQHGMFQCLNASSEKDCLLPTQICDGVQQCADNSDESFCTTYTCLEHYMKCEKDNKCIPRSKHCDGSSDCTDGQDELNCTFPIACPKDHFQCNNSRCIPYIWSCDNDDDCGDSSDEPSSCQTDTCREGFFKCNRTGRCIPEAWKCDGDHDCGEQDISDENQVQCHGQTCDPTFFRCDNGHCIPGRWRCDYYDDCRDSSDERNCIPRNCTESEYRCNNSKCIPGSKHCDRVFDCIDRSDEMGCDPQCDSLNEFQCDKIPHCVPKKWLCDGDTDCADGTDEWNCNRVCTENEFKCKNAMCQPNQYRCDGDDDCGDNSDESEEVCAQYACPPGRFRCNNHKCIWNSMVCDGRFNCPDGEDEHLHMCAVVKNCLPPNYTCMSRTECLHPKHVCDGIQDCKDGSDENFCNTVNLSKNDSCHIFNGGCQHHCNDTAFGPQCTCKPFYILNADGLTCSFDSPCDNHGTCSQKCEFDVKNARVVCSCEKGFTNDRSIKNDTCFAAGDEPHLLVAEKDNLIVRKKLRSNETESVTLPPVKNNNTTSQIISIDVDTTKNIVFFINQMGTEYFLMKLQLPPNTSSSRKRRQITNKPADVLNLSDKHFDMTGLAVDWVSQNIYLTDATSKAVHRYNYMGQLGKVVAKGNISNPNTVAVDPIAGYIFWTDWGSIPKIERANLDGSDRKVIVATELSWPTSLTLDPSSGWIYWTDTKKYTVEIAKYDGSHRHVIHNSACFLSDAPYALEIFEDYIYVLTHKLSQVLKLHKFKNCTEQKGSFMFYTLSHARDITIIQENKQPKVSTKCNSTACIGEVCFNKPQDPQGYVCVCPDGSERIGKRCEFEKLECDNYCRNGGSCLLNKVTEKRKCSCTSGYSGDRCERYACTDYCRNGGICHIDPQGHPQCLCSAFYEGERCDTMRSLPYLCLKVCKNNAQCFTEPSGYIVCVCEQGFFGKRCDQCDDLTCNNGGSCYKENGHSKCDCPSGLDPKSRCLGPLNCTALCLSGFSVDSDTCNCACSPTYLAKDCSCAADCKHGKCILENGESRCDCHEFYTGDKCDICRCEPSGSCFKNSTGEIACSCDKDMFGKFCEHLCVDVCGEHGHCTQCQLNKTTHTTECLPENCVCDPGFTGPTCSLSSASQQGGADSHMVIIILVCVIIITITGSVVMIIFMKRRKRRASQYGHKRMDEHANMNVTNPVYLKQDEGEEDPLSGGVIFRGNNSTNFDNPMYEVYSSDSTQKLLSDFRQEENHNFDDLQVNFVPTNHLSESRDGTTTSA